MHVYICVGVLMRLICIHLCVYVIADRLVNSVCLRADGSKGADLFLRLEAEAAQCLMSPLGRNHMRRVGMDEACFCCISIQKYMFVSFVNDDTQNCPKGATYQLCSCERESQHVDCMMLQIIDASFQFDLNTTRCRKVLNILQQIVKIKLTTSTECSAY